MSYKEMLDKALKQVDNMCTCGLRDPDWRNHSKECRLYRCLEDARQRMIDFHQETEE